MASRRRFNAGRDLARALDIPVDVVLDLPRLVLLGNLQVLIENHRGIIEYTGERIRVSLPSGELRVEGSGLVLRRISLDEMLIEGEIGSIAFQTAGGHTTPPSSGREEAQP
ncbi:MAG TPA: sporulation protein YqfC [Firmicutes bacterium]|nr:sporulation protein YqfC [Bacillota bacterium]